MERTQKHWTADSHHRKTPRQHNASAELDPVDLGIPLDGPCDGEEAGKLLALFGKSAIDVICERVAKGVQDELPN